MSETQATDAHPHAGSPRIALIRALLELASERPFGDITLHEIASRAGVSLAILRDHFPSKGAILGAYAKHIDGIVLQEDASDLAQETAKDRLFDVLMRRLDAMAADKLALERIMAWLPQDPLSAAALNTVALNSMRFMLEAAGLSSEGPMGALKLQGLVVAWTRILQVWFKDEDPGLAATMAAMDKELTRGGQVVARLDDFSRLTHPLRTFARNLKARGQQAQERRRTRWSDAISDTAEPGL